MNAVNLESSGKLIVKGPQTAKGSVKISGSKNAVLPIMAATLLTKEKVILKNVPDLADVQTMIEILEHSGKTINRNDEVLIIEEKNELIGEIPYEPVRKMRASFNVYGPLTLRTRETKVALPGGCSLGVRPVNYHLEGLKKMGIESTTEHGYVMGKIIDSKNKINISLPFPSVGATEHLISSAVLLEGKTIKISNCAMEPEITDLIDFLSKMGANIEGKNTSIITIKGVKELHGLEYSVSPDRIEAGTYIIMGAIIGEKLKIERVCIDDLRILLNMLEEIGIEFEISEKENYVEISKVDFKKLKNLNIDTAPYPGFPTDLQPQISVLASLIPGKSTISENIFSSRFNHIDELNRMGAKIRLEDNTAIIDGVDYLSGAPIQASDLRAAAALLIAALSAEGESIISNIDHIFRGYEKLKEKLDKIGIQIEYN
ncbi:MAG: UDP-N-acetylglucosamine 1-carboxyvinyltransferase [Thermotogota bacterium]